MKDKLKIVAGFVVLNLVIYPFGVLLAVVFLMLCQMKYIKVLHWERFPHFEKNTILVANHPSMLDPFLIGAMFFKGYLLNPIKYGPIIVSDRNIFYDSWYWFWLRPFMIPVGRGNRHSEAMAFARIKKAIEKGRMVVIFPEGGRTFCGERFLYSSKGKRIRTLKEGIALLVRKTNVKVVPLWIEGTEKALPNSRRRLFTRFSFGRKTPMIVKIGEPLRFATEESTGTPSREEIIQIIASSLLQLADEEA